MKNYTKPNININAPAEDICANIDINFNSAWHELVGTFEPEFK